MYNAVKRATVGYGAGAIFTIHQEDAMDLVKLTVIDLQTLGYDSSIAEKVASALMVPDTDFGPLERTMGIRFVTSWDAPRLPLG